MFTLLRLQDYPVYLHSTYSATLPRPALPQHLTFYNFQSKLLSDLITGGQTFKKYQWNAPRSRGMLEHALHTKQACHFIYLNFAVMI